MIQDCWIPSRMARIFFNDNSKLDVCTLECCCKLVIQWMFRWFSFGLKTYSIFLKSPLGPSDAWCMKKETFIYIYTLVVQFLQHLLGNKPHWRELSGIALLVDLTINQRNQVSLHCTVVVKKQNMIYILERSWKHTMCIWGKGPVCSHTKPKILQELLEMKSIMLLKSSLNK